MQSRYQFLCSLNVQLALRNLKIAQELTKPRVADCRNFRFATLVESGRVTDVLYFRGFLLQGHLLTHCPLSFAGYTANVCFVCFKGSAVAYVVIRNQHMQSSIEDRCGSCGSLLQLVPSQYEPTAPWYKTCFCSQRRAAEFLEKLVQRATNNTP